MYPARQHLLKTCQSLIDILPSIQRTQTQIILLVASPTLYRNDTDRELLFRQESNFFYLSGSHIPSAILLAVHSPSTTYSHLFIPPIQPADILWSIPPPTPDQAKSTHQVDSISLLDALHPTLDSLTSTHPTVLIHTLPNSPNFPSLPLLPFPTTDAYLLSALHRARLTKSPYEISQIRIANAISSSAHETVMRLLGSPPPPLSTPALLPAQWRIDSEAEAEAVFVATCRRQGAIHQAYLPIVASASRASTLHYCCNDRPFACESSPLPPQVLLIDAGCEWNCYASDITRTMPIGNNGKFTPEARAIYTLVHRIQSTAMRSIKPTIHWDAIHLDAHRTLIRGFLHLGIFRSQFTEAEILKSGVSNAFFPHGLGHSLGLDVHDVPSASRPTSGEVRDDDEEKEKEKKEDEEAFYRYLRLRLPLQVGMVVTVEPGIYFSPHLLEPVRGSVYVDHDVLARYEAVGGVRIEDVVVVTPDGCENLTTVPSDVDWVEGVCSGAL